MPCSKNIFGFLRGQKIRHFLQKQRFSAWAIIPIIEATNTLDFGQSQGVLATAVTGTSTLNVTCTNTTPYNVGLNAGTGTGSGSQQNLTVHGNIPAQATPQPDTYKSTITATVYF